MPAIDIYTTPFCPYCRRAKDLLTKKGVAFREIDVSEVVDGRAEMETRAPGARTVPQIFIDDRHIGGSDELADLDRTGHLDPLLGLAP